MVKYGKTVCLAFNADVQCSACSDTINCCFSITFQCCRDLRISRWVGWGANSNMLSISTSVIFSIHTKSASPCTHGSYDPAHCLDLDLNGLLTRRNF